MRIAWYSNAPWVPGGYGVQTDIVSRRLRDDGHDVAIACNYGLAGAPMDYNGIKLLGHGSKQSSEDLAPVQMAWWMSRQPADRGIGITLYDVWPLRDNAWSEIPLASWTPIDHGSVTPGVAAFFSQQSNLRIPIAMSEFGRQKLIDSGVPENMVLYAPHSFEKSVYRPIDNPKIRKEIGVPEDAHLTTIVAMNKGLLPIRKCFPEMLAAWAIFAKKNKDAFLYIHTELFGLGDGMNIPRYLQMIDAPSDRIKFVDQFTFRNFLPQEYLARVYSGTDVLLSTSRGEGFGVPVIEAQACGAPVIVTDFTAQTELAGPGWKVDGNLEWDELQQGWWKVPSVSGIIDALENSYSVKSSDKKQAALRKKAVEFASQYEADSVHKKFWHPIINRLEAEVKDLKIEYKFKD